MRPGENRGRTAELTTNTVAVCHFGGTLHVRSAKTSGKERLMKRHLLIGLLVLMSIPSWAGEWELVWSDEFSEPGLPNPAKWDYETGFIRNDEQ
jgi:hypothetical protein